MIVRKRTGAILVVLGMTLIGGCTSGATGGQPPTGTGQSGTTTPAENTVTLGDTDKGRTVTVAVGAQVTITLQSTYWRFADPQPPAILTPVSTPLVNASPANSPGCVPGQGCGTVTMSFRAAKPGTTTASATRTTCGEARGCPGDEGTYQVTITVH
jgi:hypothetical protein